jgi:5-methylcytosine-specific restriction endonuclease McrA
MTTSDRLPPLPEPTPQELNVIMRQIETTYRNEHERWNVRLGTISALYTRRYVLAVPPMSECWRCQKGKCRRHYYFRTWPVELFWARAKPWEPVEYSVRETETKSTCPRCGILMERQRMSVDHIRPISLGGLEWDRDNLRWMCLKCNVSRGNRIKVPPGHQSKLGDA